MTNIESAQLRLKYSASIIKNACEGKNIPEGVTKADWIAYNQACIMEEVAIMLGELLERKTNG